MQQLSLFKELLAPVPGTEETRRALFVAVRFKPRFHHVERNTVASRHLFEIGRVGLIIHAAHPHMECLHLEVTAATCHPLAQQVKQGERVFAAGKSDEDAVAAFNEAECAECLPHLPLQAFFQVGNLVFHLLFQKHKVHRRHKTQECHDMVPMKSLALEHDGHYDGEHHQ